MEILNSKFGLSSEEASQRLTELGLNELAEKKRINALDIFARQFSNFVLYVLLAAAVISLFLGETVSFLVVMAIIVFSILLGFVQEYRAEKAMDALKKIVQPLARVYRDGKLVEIPSVNLVPGDVVSLEMGDRIPADGKIIEMVGIRVDESALTGESVPVEKKKGSVVYAGTQVVHGRCKALVVATGMKTKIGNIAGMIQTEEGKTPLQLKIEGLSKTLAFIALGACVLTFAVGLAKGAPVAEILLISLALAVAAVPEGLPLTLTITLAYGMKRMSQHSAIVRKMLAVETLGSVTVIATDKTGTLTKNEMTVEKVYVDGATLDVSGAGYVPKGTFALNGREVNPLESGSSLPLLLRVAALCNNAVIYEKEGVWNATGDPTEAALVVAASKAELWKDDLEVEYRRVEELVFTSERKLMSIVSLTKKGKVAFSKGAPENLLAICSFIEKNGKVQKLREQDKVDILEANRIFSKSAYRVIGFGYKPIKGNGEVEGDLVFLGLAAMRDPPREEVVSAIATCKQAGIKVVMITGDNEETAKAIARRIGLLDESDGKFAYLKDAKLKAIVEDHVITGAELETLSDKEFLSVAEGINVYARTMPEHKLRIVQALQGNGEVVAMTGDGVNDAPALKKADVGVAMGLKGTDVAKESSSIVLQDDNFATIVEAVRQGRAIYSNIEKFTCYLISRNFTEVLLILLGMLLLGFDLLPLLALQILFINTFDEIIPAISLGLDPAGKAIMARKPRKPNVPILNKRNLLIIAGVACFLAVFSFAVFVSNNPVEDLHRARTMTFATIIAAILFVPFAFRSLEESILHTGIFSNKLMVFGAISTFLVTLGAMYIPAFQEAFSLDSLSAVDWVVPLGVGFGSLLFVELMKFVTRKLALAE